MNKVLIGFNVILAAAVIYLFVRPSGKKDEGKKSEIKMNAAFTGDKGKGEIRVAVVNIDSLNQKYDLFKDEAKKLQEIGMQIQQELQTAQQNAMRQAQAIESKNPALMTDREKQSAAMRLQKLQEDFMMLKNSREVYMDSLQTTLSAKGTDALKKFLDNFAAEKKIDFVLRDGYASSILYSDKVYDITDIAAKALNEEYHKNKGQ